MSGATLALAAACMVLSTETDLSLVAGGWHEQTTFEIAARGDCDRVDLVLPPRSRLAERSVRLKRLDRRNLRVGDDHWSDPPARLDDEEHHPLHLPEIRRGDRALLEVEVLHDREEPWRWRPGDAVEATLRFGGDRPVSVFGEVEHRGRRWTTADPGAEVRVHRGDPREPAIPTELEQAFDEPPVQSAMEALADMETMVLLPRAIDGPTALVGPPALRRGAVDDRGFARTLVMKARGGPDDVSLGQWVPDPNPAGHADVDRGEVAVWWGDEGPQVLLHPEAPVRHGVVWTPRGRFTVTPPEERPAEPFATARRHRPPITSQQALLIDLPEGADPMVALLPGRGSRLLVRRIVPFPVDARARPWVLDLPPEVEDVGVSTDPPDVADPLWTLRLRDDDAAAVVGPTHHRFALVFEWAQRDAPVCGVIERGDPPITRRVGATRGEVAWDTERSWHLASWEGEPVLPDRASLLKALDRRFDRQSMPEPGLPMKVKGAQPGWDLAALLRPTLFERARPATLPRDPARPRPLHRARAHGAVTPLEAALILRLYAIQSDMPAQWAMVRPAWHGDLAPLCPQAYPEALVRIDWEGASRWIDPACTQCAPFEIRPHLEGAAALGPGIDATPPPTPGAWHTTIAADRVTWVLEGPAALRFREWVATVPGDERPTAIAERLAGPGATLLEREGITTRGEPIRLVASRPEGDFTGEWPLVVPAPRPDGTVWMDWRGPRTVVRTDGHGTAAESTLEVAGATWLREVRDDGAVLETLEVQERRLAADAARTLRKAPDVADRAGSPP